MALECTRPFWEILADAPSDPNALWNWVFAPYCADIGVAAVGGIMFVMGFVGLYNWTESWTMPLVWTSLVAPLVAVTALPGGLIRLIGGVVTLAVAMLFLGVWWWYGRA